MAGLYKIFNKVDNLYKIKLLDLIKKKKFFKYTIKGYYKPFTRIG